MGEGMGLKVAPGRSSEVLPSNTLQLLGFPASSGHRRALAIGGQRGHLCPPALRT